MKNITNASVKQYLRQSSIQIKNAYDANPSIPKFIKPSEDSSEVQERTMRLGIEQRSTLADSTADLYSIALTTLEMDYISNYVSTAMVSSDFDKLFVHQLNKFSTLLFMAEVNGKLSVVRCAGIADIVGKYKYGKLDHGFIPRLYN